MTYDPHAPKSEEQKAKIAAALKGRKISEETRRKMSEAHKKGKDVTIQESQEEQSIRPKTLNDYVGNEPIKAEIKMLIQSSLMLNKTIPHVLVHGPAGTGKTSLFHILSEEAKADTFQLTHASLIKKPEDLYELFKNMSRKGLDDNNDLIPGETPPRNFLCIDEVHSMKGKYADLLLKPLEDGLLPMKRTNSMTGEEQFKLYRLPPFTALAASNKAKELNPALLDRFPIQWKLSEYTVENMQIILSRAAGRLKINAEPDALLKIAQASKSVPRIGLGYLNRVWSMVVAQNEWTITNKAVDEMFDLIGVFGEEGIDATDISILKYLQQISPMRIGVARLAAIVHESTDSFLTNIEPFLERRGYIRVAPSGRLLGPAGAAVLRKYHLIPKLEEEKPEALR